MKVLLLADIHSNITALRNVLNTVESGYGVYDLLVCVGDFTDFGPVSIAEDIVSELRTFLGFILTVPGNCDPPGVGGALTEAGISLAGKSVEVGGYKFYGGGSGTGGPYAVSEEDLERVLRSVAVPGGIMVSHMPPRGVCDGAGLGSVGVRNVAEEFTPAFVLCGHVHEARGTGSLGEAIVVNPGPVTEGNFAFIDLKTKNVELGVVDNEKGTANKE